MAGTAGVIILHRVVPENMVFVQDQKEVSLAMQQMQTRKLKKGVVHVPGTASWESSMAIMELYATNQV